MRPRPPSSPPGKTTHRWSQRRRVDSGCRHVRGEVCADVCSREHESQLVQCWSHSKYTYSNYTYTAAASAHCTC
eukprot:1130143-Rhodomonas_salina.1